MKDKPLIETNPYLRNATPEELDEMIKLSVDSSTAIEREGETMSIFTIKHINRHCFPDKSILVIEDDLMQQGRFAEYLLSIFGHQSSVRVNFCASAVDAIGIILSEYPPNLIILDHDLQLGSGSELLTILKEEEIDIPIITASGIPSNNSRMKALGAKYEFVKDAIIDGKATDLILKEIGAFERCPSP